jgi:hypothetical protein
LVQKARNDKSKFLAQAGFTQETSEALKVASQKQALAGEAVEDRSNEYGTFYQVEGDLVGTNGVNLSEFISCYSLVTKTDRWQISVCDPQTS